MAKNKLQDFDDILLDELYKFNNMYFPSHEYRYKVRNNEIDEKEYSRQKEKEFSSIYTSLINQFGIELLQPRISNSFLEKWFLLPVRKEIDFVLSMINNICEIDIRNTLMLILSRTVRSCRATKHIDLATLIDSVSTTYYCQKHYKICKPLFSILNWWEYYSKDSIKRFNDFDKLRTDTRQYSLTGDSQTIDLVKKLGIYDPKLSHMLRKNGVNGIFTSPPYVGMIDYHEQHAYAYELFKFTRQDNLEIGAMFRGKGIDARNSYVDGISKVLINMSQYLVPNGNVFIVANDSFHLYKSIAERANLDLVQEFRRPVLNRTEKDKNAYSETIFHFKKIR